MLDKPRGLRTVEVPPAVAQSTVRLLRDCDRVKSARLQVDEAVTGDRVSKARDLAREIEEISRPQPIDDELAAEAILFEGARAPIATTLPSHVSLLTSTSPWRHGIENNQVSVSALLDSQSGVRTMAQVLEEIGYATAGFVSAAPLKRVTGIAAGFDSFDGAQDK